jgi:RNA polymerase-interacting CarD/CdnL/TRCF family regulator
VGGDEEARERRRRRAGMETGSMVMKAEVRKDLRHKEKKRTSSIDIKQVCDVIANHFAFNLLE